MKDHIKNTESILYNRGSKKFVANLLSDKKNGNVLTKNDLNNIIYKYDNEEIVFYQNKKTKKKYRKEPSDYNTKKYRKFTDVPEPRKTALKMLNKYLSELKIPNYVFAKTEGGYVANARFHKGNTNFLLIDIASFFPNCKFKYVKNFFMSGGGFKMKNDLAQRMAELVTVPQKENHKIRVIPQGFPTSTLISFFSYKKMFSELNKLAIDNNLKFSTYVDDVTFSTSNESFNFTPLLDKINIILAKYGHKRKEDKTQICILKDGQCPTITGVWIKRYKVRASRKMYKKMIYNYRWLLSNKIIDGNSYMDSWKHYVALDGLINTIDYIEPVKKYKRVYIKQYLNDNKKNYIQGLSPYVKKFNSNYWKSKFYNAYLSDNINNFYLANKEKLKVKKIKK